MVQFAARLGTGQSTISRYESGAVVPPRSMLILLLQFADTDKEKQPLLEALGVTADLREGWPPGELEKALQEFDDLYSAAKRRNVPASNRQRMDHEALLDFAQRATVIVKEIGKVHPALVEVLGFWIKYHSHPEMHEAFETAAAYLAIEIPARALKAKKTLRTRK
jgi:transcriptional regulator with XRE-family HTH domain